MADTTITGIDYSFAARATWNAPHAAISPPFAIIAFEDMITLSTLDMRAYTLESVIKLTWMPASCSIFAV
jgi:acid phosphatase family membrane protein YuiD